MKVRILGFRRQQDGQGEITKLEATRAGLPNDVGRVRRRFQRMQGAICPFESGAPALTKGMLLRSSKGPFGQTLSDVRAEPVAPARFVLAITGEGNEGRRRKSSLFREPLKLAAAQFLVGEGSCVLPVFRLFQ